MRRYVRRWPNIGRLCVTPRHDDCLATFLLVRVVDPGLRTLRCEGGQLFNCLDEVLRHRLTEKIATGDAHNIFNRRLTEETIALNNQDSER